MLEVVLAHQVDFATWRAASRHYVLAGVLPQSLRWRVAVTPQDIVWSAPSMDHSPAQPSQALTLSRRFVGVLGEALQAHDPERFDVLYRIMYRLTHGELELTSRSDPDLQQLRQYVLAVRAETLRFREAFSAFSAQRMHNVLHSAPAHYILEANARYCMERNARSWRVEAPYRRMEWAGGLRFAAGTDVVRKEDDLQWQADGTGIWRGYSLSLLPPNRKDVESAATVSMLAARAMDCRACALWQPASRTVFGEGAEHATIMLVGEQPGDQEDQQGRPFVGPAGQVLDNALRDAGLNRDQLYVTNAVKHFHFTWNGTRRLHQKPEAGHIDACRVWLEAERRLVQPKLLVMLGVTAAQSVLQKPVTIARSRSRLLPLEGQTQGLVTVHPSYLLRLPDEDSKQREYARFVEDLRLAAQYVAQFDAAKQN
ncbi:UdgX family uracil-DNA binding protein [Acetobacter sp. LMG 32666]|uniref:UdgX family uracil-DNA binding protein n=1 Tax=Acetobacter sp. LMG 32666 TaxID=2959295 RepID=UPI0030C84353